MKELYHCLACNREFIEKEMGTEYTKSSGHQITQRILENKNIGNGLAIKLYYIILTYYNKANLLLDSIYQQKKYLELFNTSQFYSILCLSAFPLVLFALFS